MTIVITSCLATNHRVSGKRPLVDQVLSQSVYHDGRL